MFESSFRPERYLLTLIGHKNLSIRIINLNFPKDYINLNDNVENQVYCQLVATEQSYGKSNQAMIARVLIAEYA